MMYALTGSFGSHLKKLLFSIYLCSWRLRVRLLIGSLLCSSFSRYLRCMRRRMSRGWKSSGGAFATNSLALARQTINWELQSIDPTNSFVRKYHINRHLRAGGTHLW